MNQFLQARSNLPKRLRNDLVTAMKILILSKQVTSRVDLIANRFGRVWHFADGLRSLGHEVIGIAANYHGASGPTLQEFPNSLVWYSRRVRPWSPFSWHAHTRFCIRTAIQFKPDITFAVSDAFHLLLGRQVAAFIGSKLWVDFYDDYECFTGSRLPGIRKRVRSIAHAASGVSCVTALLSAEIKRRSSTAQAPIVIPNGVNSDQFKPGDKETARRSLGLPTTLELVGTAGALDGSRGLNAALQAIGVLRGEQRRDVKLVLAGTSRLDIRDRENIIPLGNLDFAQMPTFWSAMDVAIVSVLDDDFGRYCFPLKLAEARACGLPLVCARVGVMKDLICRAVGYCLAPRDPTSLASALDRQLADKRLSQWRPEDWRLLSERLSEALEEVLWSVRLAAGKR